MSRQTEAEAQGTKIKNPEDWTTGDQPMTGAQESYFHTLAQEAGEPVKEELTKAEASVKIDELQEKTGRGVSRTATTAGKKKSSRRK